MLIKLNNSFSFLVSEKEIKELEQSYNQFLKLNNSKQYQMTLQIFSNILSPVLPSMLISAVFEAFDENRDGKFNLKVFFQIYELFIL